MTQKAECEILLNALLPLAEKLLKKHGEFYPIGAVLKFDDTVEMNAIYDGNEFPDSKEVIKDLIDHHRKASVQNEIKVSGIAWNASITADGKSEDAIIVSLEHTDDYSVLIGIPYKVGLFKRIKFGELFAQPGKHDVFDI